MDRVGNRTVAEIRKDFPIYRRAQDSAFVFLDSGASSQKPTAVLDAMDTYYSTTHANVHRGVYAIAERATELYENARVTLGRFIGAPKPAREIVFTKNATEAINLAAYSLARNLLRSESVVVLTEMEHHANLVPWMILKEQIGFEIRYIPFDADGFLDLSHLDEILDGSSIVAATMASNVFGTLTPIKELAEAAHSKGAIFLADGAQYVPHYKIDVKELGIDLLAMTGHKMLGPTGIGALWGREELLKKMPPFMGGGDMIEDVRLDGFTPNEVPYKFEAGTPPIAEAIGLAEAVRYLEAIGMDEIRLHEESLLDYALKTIGENFGDSVVVYGPTDATKKGGVVSFTMEGVHPHDLSQILDQSGVCVRAGHHCAKPVMKRLGVGATARASFYIYNDKSDVDSLVEALAKAQAFFA
ncbi:MAG: SufS family cysteine desulfurase [Acidimicrobiaceae bacterium]|nr:SufS family cysteine desulfurase [Acidimicrobiaceae bacterium]